MAPPEVVSHPLGRLRCELSLSNTIRGPCMDTSKGLTGVVENEGQSGAQGVEGLFLLIPWWDSQWR